MVGVLDKGQCLLDNIHYNGNYNNTSYSYTPIEEKKMDTDIKNNTHTKKDSFFLFLKLYEFPISAVLFIFGTTGNVILIIIITCNKDMRTVPNMYILNLAISDMIILTFLFFYVCVNRIPIFRLYDDIKLHSFHFALEYQSV